MSNDNEKSYDKIANQFSANRKQSKVNKLVIEFGTLLRTGDSILDVGCGTGVPIARYLADRGFKITGIDISSKLLVEARKNVPEGIFFKSDVIDLRTEEKFEGIVAWDSLFHLKLNEHEQVFKKLYSSLKDNGYLLFTHGGGIGGEITGEMYGHKFTYSTLGSERTKELLEDLGFKILTWEVDELGNGYMIGLARKTLS
jgi:ubiquinone/menaquinone biosynthesis C-methylase UbiE